MSETSLVLSALTILAIILGPIIALDIQRRLDRHREARSRRLTVFKTLMAYRMTPLSPYFVQALNLIDVEFNAKSANEQAVRNAWKVLLDHFGDLGRLSPAAPSEKTADLTATLLIAMGKSLGYDFDEVQIKKGAYYPMGLGNVEQEQHALRRGLLDVLLGKRRVPVGIFEDKFPEIHLQPEPRAEDVPAAEDLPKLPR